MMVVMDTRVQIRLEVRRGLEGAEEFDRRVSAMNGPRCRAVVVPVGDECHMLITPDGYCHHTKKAIEYQLGLLERGCRREGYAEVRSG